MASDHIIASLCRRFLHPFFVDAFVGAMGEIGQLSVLYPLDTIKVRFLPTRSTKLRENCGTLSVLTVCACACRSGVKHKG